MVLKDSDNKEEEIAKLSKQKQEIVDQAQKLLQDFDWSEITESEEAGEVEKEPTKKDKKSKKKSEDDDEGFIFFFRSFL